MEEKINNIIPTLMGEIESDEENESDRLLKYYLRCSTEEKAVVNNVMIYIVAGAKFGRATTTLVESQRVRTPMIVSWASHS